MAIEEIYVKKTDTRFRQHKEISETIIDNLRKLGLTKNESKIYLYLRKYGPKKAIDISNQQKIPRTETYYLLSTLQKKGVISVIFEKPTKFMGLPFEKVISTLISNEQKKIDKLEIIKKEVIELGKHITILADT